MARKLCLTPRPNSSSSTVSGRLLQDHAVVEIQEGLQLPAKVQAFMHHQYTTFLVKTLLPTPSPPQSSPFLACTPWCTSTNNHLSLHFCLAQPNTGKSKLFLLIKQVSPHCLITHPLYRLVSHLIFLKTVDQNRIRVAGEVSSMTFNRSSITASFPTGNTFPNTCLGLKSLGYTHSTFSVYNKLGKLSPLPSSPSDELQAHCHKRRD